MKRCRHVELLVAAFSVTTVLLDSCIGFEWSADSSRRPPIDRRSIAGIWRLTPIPSFNIPMKEFTVYPKKPPSKPLTNGIEELLLMLKEDGSFRQCESLLGYDDNDKNDSDDDDDDEEELPRTEYDISKTWTNFQANERLRKDNHRKEILRKMVKGIWDYRDGKLILAADRPEKNILKSYDEPRSRGSISTTKEISDMLLEGKLVASYPTSTKDDLSTSKNTAADKRIGPAPENTDIRVVSADTHLSVPKGSIKIGKFFYPKQHPSFFEQPMFQPTKKGAFALSQVIGSINAIPEEDVQVEKFRRSDFYNKTFLLTTHPIGQRKKPNANMRWSVKFNKYVQETLPSSKKKNGHDKNNDDESRPTTHVRVMQLKFFANNTFASIGGLGLEVILRGKYDIIGDKRDHLWFQVLRFGIGRSVSGSVYSEGRMLSHDDVKAYWGEISYADETGSPVTIEDSSTESVVKNSTAKLEVQGSVLHGMGLEPTPVARFIMREYEDDETSIDDDDEEDDEDDNTNFIDSTEINFSQNDGIDWGTGGDGEMFQ